MRAKSGKRDKRDKSSILRGCCPTDRDLWMTVRGAWAPDNLPKISRHRADPMARSAVAIVHENYESGLLHRTTALGHAGSIVCNTQDVEVSCE